MDEDGLCDELSSMSELELKYIRFVIKLEENTGESSSMSQRTQQNQKNGFQRMMEKGHQPYFPMLKKEDTRRDLLYNDVISLLKRKQSGWRSKDSELFAKKICGKASCSSLVY